MHIRTHLQMDDAITSPGRQTENLELVTNLLVGLGVFDHVLIGISLGIHSRLSALDKESKSIHHNEGIAINLALHEAHHLNGAPGARAWTTILRSANADTLTYLK